MRDLLTPDYIKILLPFFELATELGERSFTDLD